MGRKTIEQRFWDKIEKTDTCWLWTGSKFNHHAGPRGQAFHEGKVMLAHRLSWVLHYGPIPDGLMVCHHCDNTLCVRPDHLFLGTNLDNQRDCWNKGRGVWQKHPELRRRGEQHWNASLTEGDIRTMYALYRSGWKQAALARRFNIGPPQVHHILKGTKWTHVTGALAAKDNSPNFDTEVKVGENG